MESQVKSTWNAGRIQVKSSAKCRRNLMLNLATGIYVAHEANFKRFDIATGFNLKIFKTVWDSA